MKIVAISDTHNKLTKINLPPGDVLVISGDITVHGSVVELIRFNNALGFVRDKYKYVILVAGNHDWLFQTDPALAKATITNVTHYLQDEMVEIDGVKFYGAPWQPWFYNWAFNLHRGPEIKAKWDLIPDGIDVLITHGPAAGVHDVNSHHESMGCVDLMQAIQRVKPKLHICGHNHYGYGIKDFMGTTYINASSCNEKYMPINPPIEIEI